MLLIQVLHRCNSSLRNTYEHVRGFIIILGFISLRDTGRGLSDIQIGGKLSLLFAGVSK